MEGAGYIVSGFPGPRFFTNSGLPSNVINDVLADGDLVWVATENGVATLDRLGFARVYSNGLPSLTAESLAMTDTTLWVGTSLGVARLNLADSTWIPDGLAGQAVFSLSFDGTKLWAGARDQFHENDGSGWNGHVLTPVYLKYGIVGSISEVRALQPMPDGTIYLGVAEPVFKRRGLHLVAYDGSSVSDLQFNGPPQNWMFRLAFDLDGSLWVSSENYGVSKLRPSGAWMHYNSSAGNFNLSTVFANLALLADRTGSKWFCGLSGDVANPLPLDELQDGLDADYSNDSWTHHSVGSGGGDKLGFTRFVKAREDSEGNRWFLGDDGRFGNDPNWWGINVLTADGSAWIHINPSTTGGGMESGNVIDVAFGLGGAVYVALRKYGIQKWFTGGLDATNLANLGDDVWLTIGEIGDGFDSTEMLSLALRSDGILWIGTDVGVYKYVPPRSNFGFIPANRRIDGVGLLGFQVRDLVLDRQEDLWVATNQGLNRIARDDDNDIASFTTANEWRTQLNLYFSPDVVSPIVNADCTALAMHPDKDVLYISTSGGLSEFDFSETSTVASDLSGAYLYPNPIRSASGHNELKVANIDAPVIVEVYSMEGELIHRQGASSSDEVVWDLTTEAGFNASSGIYLVRISNGSSVIVKTISLIR
jgi:hypothetical protein